MQIEKILKIATKFINKQAATFDEYIKNLLVEIYKEWGGAPPDDVRMKATGRNPTYITVWSNSPAPEYRVTIESRLEEAFSNNNYKFDVRFFDPQTGQEG